MKPRAALTLAGFLLLYGIPTHLQGQAATAQKATAQCRYATPDTVAKLFARWENALVRKDMEAILNTYEERSILLPTVSDTMRITRTQKRAYFEKFFKLTPSAEVDTSFLVLGCNTAVAAGLYTFTFKTPAGKAQARYTYTYEWNGRDWRITSHHSSKMPGE